MFRKDDTDRAANEIATDGDETGCTRLFDPNIEAARGELLRKRRDTGMHLSKLAADEICIVDIGRENRPERAKPRGWKTGTENLQIADLSGNAAANLGTKHRIDE